MTEKTAKGHLRNMLRSYTAGSVLHLLADLFRDSADAARRTDDALTFQQFKDVERTLTVVGMGIDAACPR